MDLPFKNRRSAFRSCINSYCWLTKQQFQFTYARYSIESVQQINWMRRDISRWFRKIGIEFQPYDLRHACAIRSHLQGIPIKAAADNLGHTVDEHTKTYQRWFGIKNRKKAFGEVVNQKSTIELQKNERLKLEVERLKFSENV